MSTTLLEIPGYRVHGQLGKGGMAEVFLATQESLSRKVAIKVLRSAEDETFSQRFIKEAHIVASLNHPSIITIYDIDRLADGRYYLAMEFLPGGDLARHKGELFAPERALQIVRQVASGLAVVHDKGLVHRDVKPANVLFRGDGTAVLTDFGVAKDLDIDSELTQFGVAVGSPAYSSPEQAQCQPLDARSDIYSLGVILLEMLTGSNPFRGGNYTQTVVNHVQMEPPLPDSLGAFRGVLARMLAKKPDERFADCRALLAALDEVELSDLEETQIRPALVLPEPAAPVAATDLFVWFEDTSARDADSEGAGIAGLPECLLPWPQDEAESMQVIDRDYAPGHAHLLSAVRLRLNGDVSARTVALYTSALSVGTVAWIGTGPQYERAWNDLYATDESRALSR